MFGEKKQAFLDFEKVIFKKSENLYFCTLVHDFGQKFKISFMCNFSIE